MRDSPVRRLAVATTFATLFALFLAFANPVDRIKADLRADARGLVVSLEFVAANISG